MPRKEKKKKEKEPPPPPPKPKKSLVGPPQIDWTAKYAEYCETQRRLGLPVPDAKSARVPGAQPSLPDAEGQGFVPPTGGWRRSGKFWVPPPRR